MSKNPRPERLLKTIEAADFLSTSPWTLYEWVKEEKIPYVRFNKRTLRFRVHDLEQFLHERTHFPRGSHDAK